MDHSLLNNVSQLNYIPFLILLSPFLSLCPLLLLPPISWPIASLGSLSSLSSLCPCPVSACLTGSDHLLVLVAKARLLQFTWPPTPNKAVKSQCLMTPLSTVTHFTHTPMPQQEGLEASTEAGAGGSNADAYSSEDLAWPQTNGTACVDWYCNSVSQGSISNVTSSCYSVSESNTFKLLLWAVLTFRQKICQYEHSRAVYKWYHIFTI